MKVGNLKMKTKCNCKPGQDRDNCPQCEGTGWQIDFAAIRNAPTQPKTKSGSYRTQDGKAQIDWELKHEDKGPVFSATGEYNGSFGQCLEEIGKAYPADERVQEIVNVWRKYHLNNMKAGTPEQEAEIEQARKTAEDYARQQPRADQYFYDAEKTEANWHALCKLFGFDSHYTWACDILRQAGLLEVKIGEKRLNVVAGDGGNVTVPVLYKYGSQWLYSPIPADVLALIESWSALPPRCPLHLDKASQWLNEHGLKLRITLSDTKPAAWEPSGHHYRVTLLREAVKGKAGRLAFDFWGSQNDMATGKDPAPYDVLACISGDVHTPETFEDFCREFGESEDSIKGLQTFRRADRFAKRLRAFLTDEEQETIQAIR